MEDYDDNDSDLESLWLSLNEFGVSSSPSSNSSTSFRSISSTPASIVVPPLIFCRPHNPTFLSLLRESSSDNSDSDDEPIANNSIRLGKRERFHNRDSSISTECSAISIDDDNAVVTPDRGNITERLHRMGLSSYRSADSTDESLSMGSSDSSDPKCSGYHIGLKSLSGGSIGRVSKRQAMMEIKLLPYQPPGYA
jgi:hypothetical protein